MKKYKLLLIVMTVYLIISFLIVGYYLYNNTDNVTVLDSIKDILVLCVISTVAYSQNLRISRRVINEKKIKYSIVDYHERIKGSLFFQKISIVIWSIVILSIVIWTLVSKIIAVLTFIIIPISILISNVTSLKALITALNNEYDMTEG